MEIPDVKVKIWNIEDGKITEIKLDDVIYSIKKPTSYSASIEMIERSKASDADIKPKGHKKSYRKHPRVIETWIFENDIKQFSPDEFLKTRKRYPRVSLNKTISELIDEKKIIQWHDGSFKVSNKFRELVKQNQKE